MNETEFIKAWNAGEKNATIARRAGCHRSNVRRIANRLGLKPRKERFRFCDTDIREFQKLFNDPSKSVREVADEIGIKTEQALHRANKCRKLGYEMIYRRSKNPAFYGNQYTRDCSDPSLEEIAKRAAEIRASREAEID